MTTVDVAIIGGGPAGLATAIAARQKGMTAAVFDCSQYPVEKACGEGLMPDGLAALERLGMKLGSDAGYPFRGIRFLSDDDAVSSVFPNGTAVGVRRLELHKLLVEAAKRSGAELHWKALDVSVEADGVRHRGGRVLSSWTVGADGQNSRVRRAAGLDAIRRESCRFGFRKHYAMAPWTDFMELYWADDCQLYVTPVARETVCVAVISRDRALRLTDALTRFPKLQRRLNGIPERSPERGALSYTRRLRAVQNGRVALVGDASGSVDAITGEGMCLAFHQGLALADAMAQRDLRLYQRAHDRISRRPRMMSALMLALDQRRGLRRRVIGGFARSGKVFDQLLSIHVGALAPHQMELNSLLELGWRMLRA